MTQPPHEPPNQPPVPDGYGHLPGPPQPGYGQPPQGPNPYAQQPPQAAYGQPQPGPNPYAQQPPQGFGYPAAPPGHPQGPPLGASPGGPRKGRGKPLGIVAAAVAGALVLGGGGYLLLADDGDGPAKPEAKGGPSAPAAPSAPATVDEGDGKGDGRQVEEDFNAGRKPGEDKVLWLKLNTADVPGKGAQVPGLWVVGGTVVKTGYQSLTGYAAADGKEKWNRKLPSEICGKADAVTADGKIVYAVKSGTGSNANCNRVIKIDAVTGAEVWSKELAKEGLFDIMTNLRLTVSGDTLVVARTGPSTGHRLSDGAKIWAEKRPDGCSAYEYAGGPVLISATTCFKAETEQVEGIDPKTGKALWAYKLPKTWKINKVYGMNPIVVDAASEQEAKRGILVLNTDGSKRTRLSGEGNFTAVCSWSVWGRDLQGCKGAFVSGNTFWFMTNGKAPMRDNEAVAFDLSSGRITQRVPAPKGRFMTPIKAEGGKVYAYVDPTTDGKGGQIVSWPAGGGKVTVVQRHPDSAAKAERTFYTPQFEFVDGRFLIASSSLLGRDGAEEKLLMAFGK
ncbi:PQQ-binding-like beta-propeller repeat protein [Streptomyces sp. NPDC097619]|uniref:outer membrane protein assembly factor BamB family protein n=1 Tax=Streptomyces sp. NPDC097619 TaxID=3157228 RepID=UPI003331F9F6